MISYSKHFLLLLTFLVSVGSLWAQDLEGIYISTSLKEVRLEPNCNPLLKDSTGQATATYQETSIHYATTLLLDFQKDHQLVVKAINGKETTAPYNLKNNQLTLYFDTDTLTATLSNNHKDIYASNEAKHPKAFIRCLFTKLTPATFNSNNLPTKASFKNTFWNSITRDTIHQMQYYLKDAKHVVSNFQGPDFSTYDEEIYLLDTYKEHVFLTVANSKEATEYLFHLYEKSENTFLGTIYTVSGYSSEEAPIPVKLIQIPLKNTTELAALKTKLLGSWNATNTANHQYNEYANYLLQDAYTSIVFTDKNYTLTYGAVIKDKQPSPPPLLSQKKLKIIEEGTWKLSPTGTYLILKSKEDKTNSYLSIRSINNQQAQFFLPLYCLGRSCYTGIINLKKE